MNLSPEEVASSGPLLGYTEAILLVEDKPYMGEELHAEKKGRWFVGWLRAGGMKRYQQEVHVANERARLSQSPDKRSFPLDREGTVVLAKGHKHRRGLSPLDARFLLNLASVGKGGLLLDPFAGFGAIAIEAKKRDVTLFVSDIDDSLRIGLAEIAQNGLVVADARELPFCDETFDAIATEPPYGRDEVGAVMGSVPELIRVAKPDARMVFFYTESNHRLLASRMYESGRQLLANHTVRRHGGLVCRAMVF
jgi:hypothetical protein